MLARVRSSFVPFWSIPCLLVLSCSGSDTETSRFDVGSTASDFCRLSCTQQAECLPGGTPAPMGFVESCRSACTVGLPSGALEVGPECAPAAEALTRCGAQLDCNGQSECRAETERFVEACQPATGVPGCESGALRSVTEACCPQLGADACVEGLFCAALDGRTIPICYILGARMEGESCTADNQCISGSCGTFRGETVCRGTLERGAWCPSTLACRAPLQCLPNDPSRNECRLKSRTEACESDEECESQNCRSGLCGGFPEGAPCELEGDDSLCDTGLTCIRGECLPIGKLGDQCLNSWHCEGELLCLDGRCAEDPCIPADQQVCFPWAPLEEFPDQSQLCPEGQSCQFVRGTEVCELECRPMGTVPAGGDCETEDCAGLGLCLSYEEGLRCTQLCNRDSQCAIEEGNVCISGLCVDLD